MTKLKTLDGARLSPLKPSEMEQKARDRAQLWLSLRGLADSMVSGTELRDLAEGVSHLI